jgi:MarR family transcriptional regulator, organic hydroperoxide resistance regulator
MSISRIGRRRGSAGAASKAIGRRTEYDTGAASYVLPATVSRDALLEKGSDRRFRGLVFDLLTIATRMEMLREHLGGRIGISGPQYSILIAVAHLQDTAGVNVGAVARAMHVSSAFVASESGKLARLGLLLKRTDPQDRRGVLLSLAPVGRRKIESVNAEIRGINDLFFGALDAKAFGALCGAANLLVSGSRKALQYIAALEDEPRAALEAVG